MTSKVVTSPLVNRQEIHRDQEPQNETDVIHMRPLNNLSAFGFNCEQMNADRLNDSSFRIPTVRRNIFSAESTITISIPIN